MRELHLFAGSGGGILGGMLLGHTTVCAVEIEPYCQNVLRARQRDGILPEFPIFGDIRAFDGTKWRGAVDIVCGGFPCQDISAAGKGAGISGARSGLWTEMARVIGEVRPRFAFIENSPLLRTRGLSTVLKDLASMGYDARWGIMGAWHVGAPHKRDRMWILAYTRSSGAGDRCGEVGDKKRTAIGEYVPSLRQKDGSYGTDRAIPAGPSKSNVAHTNTPGLQRQAGGWRTTTQGQPDGYVAECRGLPGASWWDRDPAEIPDTNPSGLQTQGTEQQTARFEQCGDSEQRPTQPRLGRVAHELADKMVINGGGEQ